MYYVVIKGQEPDKITWEGWDSHKDASVNFPH